MQERLLKTIPKTLSIWEFPKIRGTLFWGPYNKDPSILGTILGTPIFGNSHIDSTYGPKALYNMVFKPKSLKICVLKALGLGFLCKPDKQSPKALTAGGSMHLRCSMNGSPILCLPFPL